MHDDELVQTFNSYADEWERHCAAIAYHSIMRPYLEHPACAMIVALGMPVVPMIMERFKLPKAPWEYVLQEIVGLKVIEDPTQYDPAEVRARWLSWWEQEKPKSSSWR